jgi:hypothetical protein
VWKICAISGTRAPGNRIHLKGITGPERHFGPGEPSA